MKPFLYPKPARFVVGVLLGLQAAALPAQVYDPVQWELAFDKTSAPPGSTVLARLTATIEDGWHVYSTTTPEGIPLGLAVADSAGVAAWRAHQPEPQTVYDPNFQAEVEWYTGQAVILVELDLTPAATGDLIVEALARYGACDDRQCLPPRTKTATATLAVAPGAVLTARDIPGGYQPIQENPVRRPRRLEPTPASAGPTDFRAGSESLLGFCLLAVGFGFAAILTPCVFPLIPIYMGSFMGGGERPWGAVIRQAGTFCLGVVVLFSALGGALAAFLGPFGLSEIGSNAWVNLLIAGVMATFALSMLGAFEITAPSSWTSGASARSVGSGVASTLMLSVVFTLASFACTGPFMGALLAGSVASGSTAYPVLGMTMFATGLAAPFLLLALFPALLNRLPRSGGWLATTKRTAGFVILAVGLKYLGNADRVFGWEFLTRERFLAIWIVLFALAALYLWGLVRLGDDGPTEGVGLVRLGAGAVFLALAISLVPGMFGGPLGELDAHVPEAASGGFGAGGNAGLVWIKDDLDGATAQAQAEGKPLLISFTGYACSNCKWMKANMFTKPEVQTLLRDTVLVELYTDGWDEASERHQQLQVERFRSSSIPYYALLHPDGALAATFGGQTRDIEEFRAFLLSVS